MTYLPLLLKIIIWSFVFAFLLAVSYFYCERNLIRNRQLKVRGYNYVVVIFIMILLISGYIAVFDSDIEFLGYAFLITNIYYFFKFLNRLKE